MTDDGQVESQLDHLTLACPQSELFCITGTATYVWDHLGYDCPLRMIRSIQPSLVMDAFLVDHQAQCFINMTSPISIENCDFEAHSTTIPCYTSQLIRPLRYCPGCRPGMLMSPYKPRSMRPISASPSRPRCAQLHRRKSQPTAGSSSNWIQPTRLGFRAAPSLSCGEMSYSSSPAKGTSMW